MNSAITMLEAQAQRLTSGLNCIQDQRDAIATFRESIARKEADLVRDEVALADINDALAVLRINEDSA